MTAENVEDIKSRVNIIEIIGAAVKLKKAGANHVGLCPFHTEKSGSFTVSQSRQMYKCFGCGKSGDAIQFLIEHEKKTYIEVMEMLAKRYNVELEDSHRKEYVKPVQRLEKLDARKLKWFEEERGISNDTLLRMKVTEGMEWMPQFKDQKEAPVICFNYFRGEELINIKFRGPKKSFKMAKDAQLIFYNLNALEGEKEIVIVEGEMDCLSWVEAGIYNVISVPNGAAPGAQRLEYLDNCWEMFSGIEKVIIAVDDDPAGRALKEELARRIGKERCWTVEYPSGCKDSNEALMKFGRDAIRKMYQGAKEWPLEGIMPMDEIFPIVDEWFENGYPDGLSVGIEGFDHLLRLAPGQVTTVTGIPGHGKDEFLNLVKAKLIMAGEAIGDCGFEETPAETTTKIAEKLTNRAFDFRKNRSNRMTDQQYQWAISMIDKYVKFFNTEEIEVNLDRLLQIAISLVLRFGIRYLFLNPWNWIEQNRDGGLSETEYVSKAYTKIIMFSRKYGVHVFIVAHTTKMLKLKNTQKYEVPTLYNISGSANFYNKTHNGICIYRDFDNYVTDVYVQKVKQSWLGQTGFSTYKFDTLTRQYQFLNSSVQIASKDQPELGGGSWRKIENYYETDQDDQNDEGAPF